MVYSSFVHYSKNTAHWLIDNTFPSTPTIASATAFVSWYSYQIGMSYSQEYLRKYIHYQVGLVVGVPTAPTVIPWLAPIVSSYFSIGASCCTSLTLNLIAKKFFNNNSEDTPKKNTPSEATITPPQKSKPVEKTIKDKKPEIDNEQKEESSNDFWDHLVIEIEKEKNSMGTQEV